MFHCILVPTDLSAATRPALELAARLVADDGAIVLLHVMRDVTPGVASFAPTPVAYDEFVRMAHTGEAQEVFQKVRELVAEPIRPLRIELRWGSKVEQILESAKQLDADLILLPTHAARGLARLFGSVVEPVLRQAPCPVLTLRMP